MTKDTDAQRKLSTAQLTAGAKEAKSGTLHSAVDVFSRSQRKADQLDQLAVAASVRDLEAGERGQELGAFFVDFDAERSKK